MNQFLRPEKILLIWLLFVALVGQASAAELARPGDEKPPLPVYRAVYEASYSGMNGEAVETLSLDHGGTYHAAQTLSAVVVSAEEHSQFRHVDGRLRPERYRYTLSMLFKKREQREQFDWNKNQVTHTYKDERRTEAAPAGLQDRFSSRLQLRLDLAAGKKNMRYKVAEKGRIKTYEFAVVGESVRDSFAGPVKAVEVVRVREPDSDRETRMWFVPAWHWLPLRLEQKEDDSLFTLQLKEARIGEQEIQSAAAP